MPLTSVNDKMSIEVPRVAGRHSRSDPALLRHMMALQGVDEHDVDTVCSIGLPTFGWSYALKGGRLEVSSSLALPRGME